MNVIAVRNVNYLGDYALEIIFNDGHSQRISFKSFIFSSHHPDIKKYQNEADFKNYSITEGDLEWNDYELCFPIEDLYENKNIEVVTNNAA